MLPLLALIPGLLYTGAKFVGPILEQHSAVLIPALVRLLSNSPTGSKIVGEFEKVFGSLDEEKKQQFTLELDSLLGQIEIDKIEAASESRFNSGWRPFLAWGLSLALLMSVLVEPTINYVLGFFLIEAPSAFVLSPIVMSLLSGLCGLYMVARTHEKTKGVN